MCLEFRLALGSATMPGSGRAFPGEHSEWKKVCTMAAPSSDHQFESKEPRYFQRGNYRLNMPGWEVLCFLVAGEPRRQQREVSKTLNESDFRSTVLYLADYQSTKIGTGRHFLLRTDGKRLGLLGFRLCTIFLDTLSFVKKKFKQKENIKTLLFHKMNEKQPMGQMWLVGCSLQPSGTLTKPCSCIGEVLANVPIMQASSEDA